MTAPKTPAAPTHQQTSNTSISEKECWTCGGNHEDEDCPHRVFIDRSYSQLAGRLGVTNISRILKVRAT